MNCELILKSVGYQSEPISDIPFDFKRNIVPNLLGRVLNNDISGGPNPFFSGVEPAGSAIKEQFVRGLYVTGWLKRGPSGIIGTNITDAKETVKSILEDRRDKEANTNTNPNPSIDSNTIDPILTIKVLSNHSVISWNDYLRIDQVRVLVRIRLGLS
jgi:adrenodoxin-NADP+ reductase